MDPQREKRQYNFKRYKSGAQSRKRNHNFRSNNEYTRPPNNQKFNRNNGYYGRRNLTWQAQKVTVSVEDAEEEERKKKLTDTANKLLSKIKTWSAENSEHTESQSNCSVSNEQSVSESNSNDGVEKPKRIAHAKRSNAVVKKKTQKSNSQTAKHKTKSTYQVNKATVKDFQNRIQHKLINEIMQMPKENLQNVLNDPKINPIMEAKMSHLVRENKPLIAQKLRALAEAKMTSQDFTSSQLLVNIDRLIDPVIETDLSVLPYELIKQMENIFQVQFDYSNNEESESVSAGCETSQQVQQPDVDSFNNAECKVESNQTEDLGVYECSTDEDEEIIENENVGEKEPEIDNTNEAIKRTEDLGDCLNKKRKLSFDSNDIPNTDTSSIPSLLNISVENPFNFLTQPPPELISKSTQTCFVVKNAETQTRTFSLYDLPLPQSEDNTPSSLLEEVNSIHKLINRLNERRFRIFLDLVQSNPSCSFVSNNLTRDNFVQSLSNGTPHVGQSLLDFFETQKGGDSPKKFKQNKKKKKSKVVGHSNSFQQS